MRRYNYLLPGKLADLILGSESCLYSQWFPGSQNAIADSLSRDFHINDTHLCDLLLSHFPDQGPFGLTILPVPPDIVSWLTCLLLSQLLKEPWLKEPTRSNFTLGLGFNAISPPLNSPQIPTSTASANSKRQRFSVPSLMPSKKVDLALESLALPSNHRPLSWLTDQTQGLTGMESLHSFYNGNSGDINL
jgi:hypothetical protein